MAVVRIVVDAQHGAILEPDAARALDLDVEQVDWILQPADFEVPAVKRAILDLGAFVVGHEFTIRAPAHGSPGVGKAAPARDPARRNEVVRAAVHRHLENLGWKARAVDHRLVIAGQKSCGFIELADANRTKILLEEASRRLLRRARSWRAHSGKPRPAPAASSLESVLVLARAISGRQLVRKVAKRRDMIVGGPAVQRRPIRRIELSIRESQRVWRSCLATPTPLLAPRIAARGGWRDVLRFGLWPLADSWLSECGRLGPWSPDGGGGLPLDGGARGTGARHHRDDGDQSDDEADRRAQPGLVTVRFR